MKVNLNVWTPSGVFEKEIDIQFTPNKSIKIDRMEILLMGYRSCIESFDISLNYESLEATDYSKELSEMGYVNYGK